MLKLDKKDMRILSCLDMDARMPLARLARKTGISRQNIGYRLERMVQGKIVFGALAVFDSVAAGYQWYRVAFRLISISEEQKAGLLDFLKSNPHLFWLGEAGGNWDLIMNFICKDNFHFNRIFEGIISRFGPCILDYEILIYLEVLDLPRAYLFEEGGKRQRFFHRMKYNPQIILDRTDKALIRELSKNAWVSNVELGRRLGISANTVKNRISAMKKSGLLLGFRLFINPSALGYKSHILFLGINRLNFEREEQLVKHLSSIPNVTFIVKHIGRWRIGMEVESKSDREFQEIFIRIRSSFSDIITDFESFPLFADHVINYFPPGNLE